MTAVAWGHGQACSVAEGGYDTVLQDLEHLAAHASPPHVVVLIPWTQRLAGGSGTVAERVEDELAFWRHAWDAAARMGPGPPARLRLDDARRRRVRPGRRARRRRRPRPRRLRRHPTPPAARLLLPRPRDGLRHDGPRGVLRPPPLLLDQAALQRGGTIRLAEHLWAGVRALTTGPKKVLVLDLDNTLWGGVVGETGPLGVALGESPDGEAYRAFQKHAKALSRRGIVLAVASKNNEADGREPFEKNPEMVLGLDDIAAAEINWEPKGTTIRRIAEALSLGLDSFVFFDDNPAEREQVRQAIPEVAVVEVPAEPAEYVRALEAGLWFEAAALTEADAARAEQYAVERKRRELQQTAGSMEDYLRSLEMRADVREIDEADLMRVVQLLGKTNQFNLTTRRHGREDVLRLISASDAIGLTVRVEDRFGDHGLIGVLIAVPAEGAGDAAGGHLADELPSDRSDGGGVLRGGAARASPPAGLPADRGGVHPHEEERAGQRAVRPDGIPTGRCGRRRVGAL